MRKGLFIKGAILLFGLTFAAWQYAPALRAQQPAKPVPSEHTLKTERADKQVSDLTREVTAKLPQSGSPAAITRRNLIDEHLFGAMAKDDIPHATLTNDFEFCRRVYLDLTGRIPT